MIPGLNNSPGIFFFHSCYLRSYDNGCIMKIRVYFLDEEVAIERM